MRSTITLHFVSSFVRRVTYPKISLIGLHLAEKNWIEFWTPTTTTTTTDVTFKDALNYSPQQNFAMDKNCSLKSFMSFIKFFKKQV